MRTLVLSLLFLSLLGCDQAAAPDSSDSSSAPPTTSADPSLPPGVILAEDATGIWNEDQVKQYITEELMLTSVTLTPTGNGGYSASGTGAEGKQYEIEIEQKPGGIRYEWSAAEGSSGSGSFGTFAKQRAQAQD